MTMTTASPDDADRGFDYDLPAELYAGRARGVRGGAMGYRRFGTAAEAIRYAIEEIPAPMLPGVAIETGEDRIDFERIRRLYDRPEYPLARE
ncbi:hypothetical protein ACUN0C_01985 [Faunimonas sp. B44]|uniref:hypothetical protein n=1 Tax=Faunimonas sp. B44 TaxID=3461493 RepID=UPI004044EF52